MPATSNAILSACGATVLVSRRQFKFHRRAHIALARMTAPLAAIIGPRSSSRSAYLYFDPWIVLICGYGGRRYNFDQWSLCGLEFGYGRHKLRRANVLCFGKLQQSLRFLVVD